MGLTKNGEWVSDLLREYHFPLTGQYISGKYGPGLDEGQLGQGGAFVVAAWPMLDQPAFDLPGVGYQVEPEQGGLAGHRRLQGGLDRAVGLDHVVDGGDERLECDAGWKSLPKGGVRGRTLLSGPDASTNAGNGAQFPLRYPGTFSINN